MASIYHTNMSERLTHLRQPVKQCLYSIRIEFSPPIIWFAIQNPHSREARAGNTDPNGVLRLKTTSHSKEIRWGVGDDI